MRTVLKALVGVIIVLAIAWVGLWWYAEGRMQSGIVNWADEAATSSDIKISYDHMARGTSPLAATVTLTNLKVIFQPASAGVPFTITLPSFGLRIDALNPLVLHMDLPPQINGSTSRGDAAITFGSTDVRYQIDPSSAFDAKKSPLRDVDATASNISLLASSGSLLVFHIDNYVTHGTVNENAGAGQPAFTSTSTLDGMALSPLLTRLASIPFDGKIAHLALSASVTGPVPANLQALMTQLKSGAGPHDPESEKMLVQAVHDWAAKGGAANGSLDLTMGPSTLKADGALKFDANIQPQGTTDVAADHLDAFTAAIINAYPQVQDNVSQIEARLSPYLSTTPAGGQTLTLHVVYGSGTVNINGQKASDLPPIDWASLENPPAPAAVPAPAPGDGSGAETPTAP